MQRFIVGPNTPLGFSIIAHCQFEYLLIHPTWLSMVGNSECEPWLNILPSYLMSTEAN